MSASAIKSNSRRRFRANRAPLAALLSIAGLNLAVLPCLGQPAAPQTAGCVAESPDVVLALPNAEAGLKRTGHDATAKLTIIAFLETYPDTEHSESHVEATILRSMEVQYAQFSLRMRIVDVSSYILSSPPADSDLINVPYDWHLKPEEFLVDRSGVSEKHYCIRHAPAVLLYDQSGTLIQRWDGLVDSATLGMTVHRFLRLPTGRPTSQPKP